MLTGSVFAMALSCPNPNQRPKTVCVFDSYLPLISLYDPHKGNASNAFAAANQMQYQGARAIADLIQMIYSSRPFGFDQATLSNILLDARRCNTRDGVTGALVCRQDIFLQLLEGPSDAVTQTFQRISKDDRHLEIKKRVSLTISTRMFGDWAMLHDPAKTWIWSPKDVSGGILERASQQDFLEVFENLAAKAE